MAVSSSPTPSAAATGSRFPAFLSLSLLFLAFAFSFARDMFKSLVKLDKAALSQTDLGWFYDGLHQGPYAFCLFASSAIVLVYSARGMRPMATVSSPDRAVFWIRVLLAVFNVFQITWALVTVYVINRPKPQTWPVALENVARRIAYPSFFNFAWALVLALRSPAISPLQAALGLSYEDSIKLHRSNGWWMTITSVLHVSGYLVAWLKQGTLDKELRWASPHGMGNVWGIIQAAIFFPLVFASIPWIRRKSYLIFTVFHATWPVLLVASIMHATTYMQPLLPPLALFIIDRLACLYGTGSGPSGASPAVATAVRVTDDLTALLIPVGPLPSSSSPDKNDEKNHLTSNTHLSALDQDLIDMYQPGRFLSVGITTSLRSYVAHPFSIAAYSPANRTVTLMVRALGPFTRELHALASPEGEAVSVRVKGPFSMPVYPRRNAGEDAYAPTDAEIGESRKATTTVVAGGVGLSKYVHSATVSPATLKHFASVNSIKKDAAEIDGDEEVSSSSSDAATAVQATATNGGGLRKLWLCKHPAEMAMYAAVGADLTGWEVYCKQPSNAAAGVVRTSYPLFAQKVAAPLSTLARVFLYVLFVGLYLATYFVSRIMLSVPANAKYCTKQNTMEQFMRCSRWFAILPYLSVLVIFGALVTLVSVIRGAVAATERPASLFYTHPAVPAGIVRYVQRRFDADQDLDLAARKRSAVARVVAACVVGEEPAFRSCTSVPVRDVFRQRAHATGASFVDDAQGL
ncbi:Ferric reductase like transmembrane component [Blastocladiella emersonii ATCC 22665]|nr:Ferric reductase like transmembrane component [Blastocladiella emersonii ATCC 22665]